MSFRLAGALSLVTFAALSATPKGAAAEVGGNVDLSVFRPAIDSRGYLTVNASQVLGHKELSFGLGSLDWGHNLLRFGDPATCSESSGMPCYNITNVVTATLIAAFGVKAGPLELEFGASLPLRIMNGDRGPDNLGDPNNNNDDENFKLSAQGIGSIGLHLKTRFLKTSRPPHVGIGVIASVFLPSTNPKDSWLGESKAVPQIMGILDKEFGRTGRLRMALNGGIRIRSTTTFTDNGVGENEPAPGVAIPTTGENMTAAAEVPFGFGIAYAISKQKFDVVGEVFGTLPLGDKENYQPLEAIAGVKLYLARNSFLSLGAGRGLVKDKGANPDFRAFDRDGDGILDNVDSARTIPRTRTSSRTRTAAPIPTTIRTASSTSTISARSIPRTRTASRTRTAAPIPTTTRTASSTPTTSARTSPRPTTAPTMKTVARIAVASSSPTRRSRSSTWSTSSSTRRSSSSSRIRSSTRSRPRCRATRRSS
jgi:OOP family OmpA-OmpF porin